MARTREFDETRALDAMGEVFWRKGFEGASYADLMAAAGLGKGSLYAAFGDKVALYRATLKRYVDVEIKALAGLLNDRERSALGRISATYDYAIAAVEDRADRRGCFLCNAGVDMAAHDAEVEKIVQDAFAAACGAYEAAGRAAGGVNGVGDHLFAVFLGLRVMAKAGAPATTMRQAKEAALAPFSRRS